MDETLVQPPRGVVLNALSMRVFGLLAPHTAFPWPVLKTQAERMGFDGANLEPTQVEPIVDLLARGVERFNSPEAGHAVKAELRALVAELDRDP